MEPLPAACPLVFASIELLKSAQSEVSMPGSKSSEKGGQWCHRVSGQRKIEGPFIAIVADDMEICGAEAGAGRGEMNDEAGDVE